MIMGIVVVACLSKDTAGCDNHIKLEISQFSNHWNAVGTAWLGHKITAKNVTQFGHSAQERTHIAVAR